MISKILASLLLVAALNAATYDENYRVTDMNEPVKENYNVFMNGDFEKIIRYDMITMDDNDNSSAKIIDSVIKKVKELQDDEKIVKVTIIGHTNRATDDENELNIDSDTYANKIQNWFRSELDTNSAQETSKDYAQGVKQKMLDANLQDEILITEYRGGADQGFSEEQGLSNRVMVAIYVFKPLEIVKEQESVSVKEDSLVDSDKDGVFDEKDRCPETSLGLQVDPNGCPKSATLHINFNTSSDEISEESYLKVQRFSKFMKENTMYNAQIIGHTDSRGDAAKNMALSQRRAKSDMNALVVEGVEASRLSVFGRGELDPIASNKSAEGRAQNRRTEIKLSY